MEINQRKKKGSTLSGTKSKHETVIFIEAMFTARTSPLEGINAAVKAVFTEISVHHCK